MVTHSPSLPKGSSVTPFVRSSLHSKSSLHSQSFTFGSFLLAVSSLIINSIQSVFTPQVHSFTQSFPLVWNFTQLIQELRVPSLRSVLQFTRPRSRSHVPFIPLVFTLTRSTSKACPIRSFTGNVQSFHSFSLEDKQSLLTLVQYLTNTIEKTYISLGNSSRV